MVKYVTEEEIIEYAKFLGLTTIEVVDSLKRLYPELKIINSEEIDETYKDRSKI